MSTTTKGLRAFNVFSLILLGVGCLLVVTTALVQAEVLTSWDAVEAVLPSTPAAAGQATVFDPTGGLIMKRYLIGAVFVICGFAAHTWIRKNRAAATTTAAA